jgi:hypothetical protein
MARLPRDALAKVYTQHRARHLYFLDCIRVKEVLWRQVFHQLIEWINQDFQVQGESYQQ